jgi:serine/threonine protein kinase/TolB-like protein/lipopolysaccharide biosynthesis regulator YciM
MSRNSESIFHEARAMSGETREAYLKGACGDDAALRARVEALLEADAEAGQFLETVEPQAADPTVEQAPGAGRRSPSEQAGQTIGRYKLLQPIGEGGFGTVWMAEQREPVKRRVAFKIIKLGMDTKQVIARFEAERQALAMMEHPNIAKVLDAGSTETGRPYFVMEYVRGVGILEYCDTEKLDTSARLGLFIKVCNAIQHAHQKGIIHRDIKPSNVMVTLHDGVPVPKVIDFGVAKATNTELTQKTLFTEHRQMIGTPAYMSPEQAEMSGLDIDTRSDIYSLGVLLYELLTGTTPFDSKDLMSKGFAEMMRIIREQEPHKPSTRLSSLGETATRTAEQRHLSDPKKLGLSLRGDLDWIVMRCLEKDRTRRYETANGLAADINRHLRDEPVVASPPSSTYRVRKFMHRNRAAVTVAAVVVFFLLAGLSLALFGLAHVRAERDRAREAHLLAMAAQTEAAEERDRALEAERLATEAERQAQAERDRAQDAEERARLLRRLFGREELSIAVLPLANASPDPEQDYVAIGMTDSLVAELNKIDAINVKPVESVLKLAREESTIPEIARLLDVDVLLRGSVMRAGDHVRITMSLLHGATSMSLWAENYEGAWTDLFDLQREVSGDIVHEVQLQLTERDRQRLAKRETRNSKARDAYFKGLHKLQAATPEDLKRAMAFFNEAIEMDPTYALPHVGLARAHLCRGNLAIRPEEFMPLAMESAKRALEIDDSLASAWAVVGHVRLQYEWDWEGAEEAFQTALNLDPNLAEAYMGLGTYYSTIGEFDRAIEYLREAIRIDPATLLVHEGIGYVPFISRRFDVAIEFCRHALDLDEDYWAPQAWMGLTLAWQGDTRAGIAYLESAEEGGATPVCMALLASVYAMDGQTAKAQSKLQELVDFFEDANYVCPYEIATVFIALGDTETALDYLDMAVTARSECMPFMGSDPRLDPLRDDPHFDQIMRVIEHPMHGQPVPQ